MKLKHAHKKRFTTGGFRLAIWGRRCAAAAILALALLAPASAGSAESGPLRVHNIFGSNMVIQHDKPITIWGWAAIGPQGFRSIGRG